MGHPVGQKTSEGATVHGTGYKSRRNEEREFRALENLSSRNLRNRKPFCDCREQTYLAAHALQRSSAGIYTRWYCRCAAIIRGCLVVCQYRMLHTSHRQGCCRHLSGQGNSELQC